ncbi:MAG TPA: hypothetical protein VNO33_12740 [Kofleriaceae bacterium]|nr:hypothetical protein [Kofleriaceae bacterium]
MSVAASIIAIAWATTAPPDAHAFQIETSTTSGCHEQITLDALERVGWPDGREPPALDEIGVRIADDLAFDLPAGSRDPWTIALLIGVRHNDVGGADPFDLPALSVIHADPDGQPEHCIRKAEHDGAAGDQQALDACRDFVLAQLEEALGGGGEVDMDAVIEIETHLLFRGQVDVDLARYPFQLGRALHAMQDSFTHTFRDHGSQEVLHVLNWVEGNLEGNSDLERDGHPHLTALDECGSGAGNQRRREWAVDASADMLEALASSQGGSRGRLERARAVLDAHFQRRANCTAANDWCDIAEASPSAGCAATGGSPVGGPGWPFAALGLAALARASAQRARRGRRLAALVVASALLTPATAGAQPADDPPAEQSPEEAEQEAQEEEAETSEDAGQQSLDREEKVIDTLPDPVGETWGAAFNVAAAFDRGAGAVSLGARWNPWRDLGFGLDAEYNPWISVSGFEVAEGAASAYVPIIWRIKRFGTWELRATGYAGATMILFDLVGVDRGTVGVFAGLNPLGLALPIGTHTKLVVKPGDVVVSAPQLRGIPFYYHQYRFTVGLEWYP